MLSSLMSFLRELLKPTHIPEQWTKKEIELMEKQNKPPLKINRIKPTKNKIAIDQIEEIVEEITKAVICNLEFVKWSKSFKATKKGRAMIARYPKGFYRSFVIYNGQVTWSAFHHDRQVDEMIRKMAWHIFKKEKKGSKKK